MTNVWFGHLDGSSSQVNERPLPHPLPTSKSSLPRRLYRVSKAALLGRCHCQLWLGACVFLLAKMSGIIGQECGHCCALVADALSRLNGQTPPSKGLAETRGNKQTKKLRWGIHSLPNISLEGQRLDHCV